MYGLVVKLTLSPGRRDEAITLLADSTREMPGCFSYVIARDAADVNVLWVTEVWDSEASHDESLSLPAVQQSMPRVKPLIAGFQKIAVTEPIAGVGKPISPRSDEGTK